MVKLESETISDISSDTTGSASEEENGNFIEMDKLDALCASLLLNDTNKDDNLHEETRYLINDNDQCTCNKISNDSAGTWTAWDQYSDLHIRYALNLRIVGVENYDEKDSNSVSNINGLHPERYRGLSSISSASLNTQHPIFIIRVFDVETKTRWYIRKTLRELIAFYNNIKSIASSDSPVKESFWGTFRDLRSYKLPKRSLLIKSFADIDKQRILFDSFLRHTAALVSPAPLGPRRRRAVLTLQWFVQANKHCGVFERQQLCFKCYSPWHLASAIQRDIETFLAKKKKNSIIRMIEQFIHEISQQRFTTRRRKRKALEAHIARAILSKISDAIQNFKLSMRKDTEWLDFVRQKRCVIEKDEEDFMENVRHAITAFVEKSVLIPLEDHVYEALYALHSEEKENHLKQKIRSLQNMPQNFFGIAGYLVSKNDWELARREFRQMDDYALPIDKARCIVRAAKAIFKSCELECSEETQPKQSKRIKSHSFTSVDEVIIVNDTHCSHETSEKKQAHARILAADDFLPIHLFVVVTTNTSKPLRTQRFLEFMCNDPHDLMGEIGYYLTNYEAAICFVRDIQSMEMSK